jgi:hypothetical protein
MPEVVGEAYVAIRPSTEGFAQEAQTKIAGPLQAAFAGLSTAVVGRKIGDFFSSAFSEATQAAKVTAQTGAVLKSTGEAAGVSADHISDLAGSLSNLAAIDDEVIQQGENVLLTFTNIRNEAGKGNDVFDRATKAALNMSAALGTDLQGSVIQVGKALQDPIAGLTALRRVGVSFTESQKASIASLVQQNDLLGAQKIILGELEREFGGAAASQATDAARLQVAFANLKESIGSALLPVVSALAKALTPLAEFMSANRTAATALAVVFSGALLAGMIAYTVSAASATAATLGLSAAQGTAAATSLTMGGALGTAGLAAATFGATFIGTTVLLNKVIGTGKDWNKLLAEEEKAAYATANANDNALLPSFRNLIAAVRNNDPGGQLTGFTAKLKAFKDVAAQNITTAAVLAERFRDHPQLYHAMTIALEQATAAQAKHKAAIDKANESLKTQEERLADNTKATQDKVDADLAAEGSAIGMDRAIQSANETLAEHSAASLEGRDAINQAETAIVSFGKSILETRTQTVGARQATLDQIGALEGVASTLAPGSPLRQFLDGYIQKLRDEIPPEANTTITADTSQAQGAVDAYLRSLERVRVMAQSIISGGGSGQGEFVNPATGLPFGATPFGAEGAIVTRPTVALIGEAGPEALVPLNQTPGSSPLPVGGLGGGVHLHFEKMPPDAVEMARLTVRTLDVMRWAYA